MDSAVTRLDAVLQKPERALRVPTIAHATVLVKMGRCLHQNQCEKAAQRAHEAANEETCAARLP